MAVRASLEVLQYLLRLLLESSHWVKMDKAPNPMPMTMSSTV